MPAAHISSALPAAHTLLAVPVTRTALPPSPRPGPGSSSLIGLLTENGPFNTNDDSVDAQGNIELIYNPYSWSSVANTIWVRRGGATEVSPNPRGCPYPTADLSFFFFSLSLQPFSPPTRRLSRCAALQSRRTYRPLPLFPHSPRPSPPLPALLLHTRSPSALDSGERPSGPFPARLSSRPSISPAHSPRPLPSFPSSYCNNPLNCNNNDTSVGEEMADFLEAFIEGFSELKGRDLYLTGESYAGALRRRRFCP